MSKIKLSKRAQELRNAFVEQVAKDLAKGLAKQAAGYAQEDVDEEVEWQLITRGKLRGGKLSDAAVRQMIIPAVETALDDTEAVDDLLEKVHEDVYRAVRRELPKLLCITSERRKYRLTMEAQSGQAVLYEVDRVK